MNRPEPQPYLTDSALAYYEAICAHLESADALMDVDSFGLSQMAMWLDLYARAANETRDNGGVQVYKTGAEGVSAHLTVMKTAATVFDKLSTKFGLSPKDRELMKQFKVKKNEKDALDDI